MTTTPPQRATTRADVLDAITSARDFHARTCGCPSTNSMFDMCLRVTLRLPAAAERSEPFDEVKFEIAMADNSHDDDAVAVSRLAIALHARGLSLAEIVAVAKGEKA